MKEVTAWLLYLTYVSLVMVGSILFGYGNIEFMNKNLYVLLPLMFAVILLPILLISFYENKKHDTLRGKGVQ